MKDWLFRILFPKQYEQIERIIELFKLSSDFCLTAPEGVCFKEIRVYLTTGTNGTMINCEWAEVPCEGERWKIK